MVIKLLTGAKDRIFCVLTTPVPHGQDQYQACNCTGIKQVTAPWTITFFVLSFKGHFKI